MRVRVVLGVLLREAASHRLPTAATLLGVASGVAVVVAIHLASAASLESFRQTYGTLAGRATHQLTASQPLPPERLTELVTHPDVLAAQPVVEATVVLPERAADAPGRMDRGAAGPRTLRIVGIDPFLAPPFFGAWPAGDEPDDDDGPSLFERFMTVPGFALLDRQDMQRLELTEGDALQVAGPGTASRLICHGIDSGPDGDREGTVPIALVDIASAQEVLGLRNELLRIDLILPEIAGVEAGIPLEPGEVLERPARRGERASTLTRAFRANLMALGFLAVLVGSFLVFNMSQFAVTRRRNLLGKLRCLGCPARDLLTATLLEAAVLGIVGGVLGVALGRLLAWLLVDGVALTVSTLYGYIETPIPSLDAMTIAGAMVLAVGSTVIATWAPARSAARTPPAVVAGATVREPLPRWPVPVTFAALSALALWPSQGGLLLQAAAVLFLLLAVATAVPWVLGAVVRHPPRAMLIALAMGRLQRSLGRTGATAGALVMPIAMTIGITIMIGSFEREVTVWVDATIGADIYVKPAFQELAPWTARLDDELIEALEQEPGVQSVDLLRGTEVRRGDSSFLVAGSRLSALEQKGSLRVLQGDADAIYDRLRAGAVIITEPLHRKSGLGAGDALELTGTDGPVSFPIAAVFQDFSFDRGYALLDEAHYLDLYGETGVRNAALILAPDAEAEALAADFGDRFPDAGFNTTAAIHANVMEAFDNTFRVTWALQGISAALALIGVLTGLLCLHLERRHELGVLRSLGSTHRTVGRLLLIEALILVGVVAALSVPVGAVLAWILIAVVNTRSFGWSFPMDVPWDDVAGVLVMTMAAAVLAGIVPWLLVRRARIAQLLATTSAVLLLSVAAASQVSEDVGEFGPDGFLRASPERAIDLPADHGSHPATRTEWWYLTGSLTGAGGERFGFQATWFRRALVAERPERASELGTRDVMMFHGALTDVASRTLVSTERACRAWPGWARSGENGLDLFLLGHSLVGDGEHAALDVGAGDSRLHLELDLSASEPLLHGAEPGYSVKGHGPGQASWYYSLPRILATGTLQRPGSPPLPVQGQVWFDHEFGSSLLSPDQVGWDWFSVALDDGTDLMVFDMRLSGGGLDTTSSGTLRRPDGTAIHITHKDYSLVATDHWVSPHTGARYPAAWTLTVPDEALDLRIVPVVADQELQTPESTSVTYWEGLCRFEGTRRGAPVSGIGYVELVGYLGSIAERF